MSSETNVAIVVGVVVGIVAAHVGNKTVARLTEEIHKDELRDAETEGYQRGWAAAGCNARYIRQKYNEMFGNDSDEKEGTAFKG